MGCKRVATSRGRARASGLVAMVTSFSLLAASSSKAEPLALRGDALVDTQSEAQSPTGLVVLQGQDKLRPWLDAEGLVWTGAKPGLTADVLVLALRLREPRGH